MKHITSRDNPYFRAVKKLCASGRERRKAGKALLDGMHLIEAYAQRYGLPSEVFISVQGAARAEIAAFIERAAAASTAICLLDDALFAELSTVDTPSGIAALVDPPQNARGPDPRADAVLLDGVQDPGNLGSILRSAAAAGFPQALLSADCAQAWSPKTLRAAMGAHFRIDIHEHCDLPAFLETYAGQSLTTTLEAAAPLFALELTAPVAWIFGSEGQGVRAPVAARAHASCRIPMPGAVESLNVAAAAAVCLFETVRQRAAACAEGGRPKIGEGRGG